MDHAENQTPLTEPAIAWRYWSKTYPVFYVSDLKGKVGDWGYTDKVKNAIALSPTQQKRFASDMRAVGERAHFVPAEVKRASNPAKKRATPAQLAARKAFSDAAKAGMLQKGKPIRRAKNPATVKALSGNYAFNYLVSFKGENPHAGFDFLRDAKDYAQFIADRDNMSLVIKHRKES